MSTATLAPKRKVWTEAELEAPPEDGPKCELPDGGLIVSSAHTNHGAVCVRIGSPLPGIKCKLRGVFRPA